MDLSDLVKPDAIVPSLKANSKKQAIQALAEKAAEITGLEEREIFEKLVQREKLGSTGGLFARLPKPIEFEAVDDQPVDLVFLLLAPEGAGADHLKALARVARLFREPGVANKLRASTDKSALYSVLTAGATPDAA
jgi:PTS system nitrogen regulatory IIA component